jgi:hypothetical protein
MKDDPFAEVSGSHSTMWVFDPFDQPSGEGFSVSQLDTPAKFLAIKHGDGDQSAHGNRDGAGGDSGTRDREKDLESPDVTTRVNGKGTARDEKIRDRLFEAQAPYIESLGRDKLKAVGEYQSEVVYTQINDGLRSGTPLDPEYQQVVDTLDEVIAGASLDEPTVLYRGITDPDGRFADIQPGDEVIEPGYSSTSPNPLVAEAFADSPDREGSAVVLSIAVTADQPAIAADLATERLSGDDLLQTDEMQAELTGWWRMNEVILPRGTTFAVKSVKVIDTIKYVEMEIVGE